MCRGLEGRERVEADERMETGDLEVHIMLNQYISLVNKLTAYKITLSAELNNIKNAPNHYCLLFQDTILFNDMFHHEKNSVFFFGVSMRHFRFLLS